MSAKAPDSYTDALSISPSVLEERLAGKFLQLDPPRGKLSDRRVEELAKREREKEKKKLKRAKAGDSGLVGRRKRMRSKAQGSGKDEEFKNVRYDAVAPLHNLWLGYMAELLSLPLVTHPELIPPNMSPTVASTSALIPTFPSRQATSERIPAADLKVNVPTIQNKLLKAELVGCKLSVKRAKNPSLVGLCGIVLQETQSTFAVVATKSQVKIIPKKNTVFALCLPLQPGPRENSREISFDIFGDAFEYRAADRVNKKWKAGGGNGTVDLV